MCHAFSSSLSQSSPQQRVVFFEKMPKLQVSTGFDEYSAGGKPLGFVVFSSSAVRVSQERTLAARVRSAWDSGHFAEEGKLLGLLMVFLNVLKEIIVFHRGSYGF